MTRTARLLKRARMRIAMTVGTAGKWQARIARLVIRPGRVAAFAFHLLMRASKRKARLRVIESAFVNACRVPVSG